MHNNRLSGEKLTERPLGGSRRWDVGEIGSRSCPVASFGIISASSVRSTYKLTLLIGTLHLASERINTVWAMCCTDQLALW